MEPAFAVLTAIAIAAVFMFALDVVYARWIAEVDGE
jgi:hypothetical protein